MGHPPQGLGCFSSVWFGVRLVQVRIEIGISIVLHSAPLLPLEVGARE